MTEYWIEDQARIRYSGLWEFFIWVSVIDVPPFYVL